MASETTPLLSEAESESSSSKDVYDRFSKVQKRVILTIISPSGLIAPFAYGCFVPCVPQIAKELNTTGTIINYSVGTYIFSLAIGNLVCAPYASFYGRRQVYLGLLPVICVGCLWASMSANVFQLMTGCILQGLGASCLIPIGAATISDIYRLEERGTAMGMFLGTILVGPALAPIVGGLCATYASWRMMELILFTMGFISFVFMAALLPETSHPGTRGFEKEAEGIGANLTLSTGIRHKKKWVWINPLTSAIDILRSPNIFLVALASALVFMTHFVLMIPLSYTLGPRYGVTSPALIGLCLLPSGMGNIVGAIVGGRLADRAVVRGLEQRGGKWFPEDRLRATLPGALLLVPFSLLIFGLTTQFVPGRIGLVINLICLFMNGVGVDMVLPPSATYSMDILRNRSAEAVAVLSAFRNVVSAVASAAVLPSINSIGVASTNGIVAVVAWLAFGLLLLTIRCGDRLRARVDIGYTTTLMS